MPEHNKKSDENEMVTRALSVGPSTFDEKKNSVRAIATTEKPVRVFDYSQYDYVDEVLRMDGVVLPESGRVPLLNSHNRYGVEAVLGSAGDFRSAEAGGYRALEPEVVYSETDEGKSAAQKTREGHLTDYSVGYRVLESFWVPDGQKQMIAGDEYDGPVKVATQWELKELSATPIGADEYAKARSENHTKKERTMPGEDDKTKQKQTPTPPADETGARTVPDPPAGVTPDDVTRAADDAVRAERQRCRSIQNRCAVAGHDDLADDFIDRGLTLEEVADELFKKMADDNPALGAGRTQIVADAQDKFRAAVTDGLSLRAGLSVEKPADGHEDFRGRSLLRIAEEAIIVAGGNVRSMNKMDMAAVALGMPVRGVPAASTSDFPLIMSNVANKRMMQAWAEAAVTWDIFCNVVDGSDFKPMQGLDISALPTLDLLKENGEYHTVNMSEVGESYIIKTYGNMFYLNRHMVVNDDLRVFLKVPIMFGSAAKRTINNHVYGMLNNASLTMSDGNALFSAARKNIATGGAPAKATLSEGRKLMRQFKDPGGETTLNLSPKYIVAGSEYETDLDVILLSAALPEADLSSGVVNPFKAKMIPVIDSAQDYYDSNAWFMFPEKSASDTIEVAFLDGNQSPYLEDMVDFDTDGIKYKCRLDFGAGVMTSRMVKNPGASE